MYLIFEPRKASQIGGIGIIEKQRRCSEIGRFIG